MSTETNTGYVLAANEYRHCDCGRKPAFGGRRVYLAAGHGWTASLSKALVFETEQQGESWFNGVREEFSPKLVKVRVSQQRIATSEVTQ